MSPYGSGHRQIAIDVLRGYFILSMASGHLASGMIAGLLHIWIWVDGAAGFVCLSGFVLGLSQRSRWRRGAGHEAQIWIMHRAAFIWLVSVFLTIAALSLRLFSQDLWFIEDIFREDRFLPALVEVLLQRLDVPYFGILAMYVVFLLFAFFAVGALQAEQDFIVLFASLAIYIVSQIGFNAGVFHLPEGAFALGAWQLLFFMGLLAGWRWRDTLLPWVERWRRPIFVVATFGVLSFLLLAHSSKVPYLAELELDLSGYFPKYTLGPLVIVYFLCVLGFLPEIIRLFLGMPIVKPVLHLVAMFGRHSLGCFAILSLMQLVMWAVMTPDDPHGGRHIGWLALAVLAFTVFCLAVERRPSVARGWSRSRPLPGVPAGD